MNNKRKWSAPIQIYKSSEFFLDLPSHGDVKIITNCRRKIVKIIIENINYVSGDINKACNVPALIFVIFFLKKMEFNVKDIRTKILHPSEEVAPSRDQENLDESLVDDCVNVDLPNTNDGKMKIENKKRETRF